MPFPLQDLKSKGVPSHVMALTKNLAVLGFSNGLIGIWNRDGKLQSTNEKSMQRLADPVEGQLKVMIPGGDKKTFFAGIGNTIIEFVYTENDIEIKSIRSQFGEIRSLVKSTANLLICEDSSQVTVWKGLQEIRHFPLCDANLKWCLSKNSHILIYNEDSFRVYHLITGLLLRRGSWRDSFPENRIFGTEYFVSSVVFVEDLKLVGLTNQIAFTLEFLEASMPEADDFF